MIYSKKRIRIQLKMERIKPLGERNYRLFGLLMRMDSENWILRQSIASRLGELNDMDGAFKGLGKMVNDEDRFVRKAAVESISKFDGKDKIKQTLKILKNTKNNDCEDDIRKTSSKLYKQLKNKRIKNFFSFNR